MVDVPTTKLSLLIEVIEDSLPAGVKASIHKHTEEHEILRYIPDSELKTLKNQLEEMGGSKKKKWVCEILIFIVKSIKLCST